MIQTPIQRHHRAIRPAAIGLALLTLLASCRTTTPDRNPVGEPFPEVVGENLEGARVTVPTDFLGRPMLYLVGYDQDAQFDIDRWIFGVLESGTSLGLRELPTIPGLIPRILGNTIDGGMRKGIPQQDWSGVITLYRDASDVVEFLGNERRTNGYAVLVDSQGDVVRVHSEGYSPRVLLEILGAYGELVDTSP